jgi:hypothetical protein
MLADAGFVDVTVHDIPDDPLDSLYEAHVGPVGGEGLEPPASSV